MVPEKIVGKKLLPLHKLKRISPTLYQTYSKKYLGREALLKKISQLNCLWSEVIFLSPIHPKKIKRELVNAGFKKNKDIRWFKIPLKSLLIDKLAIVFKDSSKPCTSSSLSKVNNLSSATKKYYKECYKKRERPLLRAYSPHVVYKGEIDVKNLKTISW